MTGTSRTSNQRSESTHACLPEFQVVWAPNTRQLNIQETYDRIAELVSLGKETGKREKEKQGITLHLNEENRMRRGGRERGRLYYGTGEGEGEGECSVLWRQADGAFALVAGKGGSCERPGATSHDDGAFPAKRTPM
jgi:hypothetical protein